MPPLLSFYYLCHTNPQKIMELLKYFYYPDHLGSSSWITDGSGNAIQHLHYLPFGEDWVDQRNSSWNAPYTFSGKEKDAETGYGYFGARYYDSGLSIWLSVDPMSDKYPNMSPYNYCANNPVMLVDPDGRDLVLTGDFQEEVYNYMVAQNPNIKFSNVNGHITAKINIDEKTGKKCRLSKDEKKVLKAINDHSVMIRLDCVESKESKSPDITGHQATAKNGGGFLGNLRVNRNRVNANQGINKELFLAAFYEKDFGRLINHEVTEAYYGAIYTKWFSWSGVALRASDNLDGTKRLNRSFNYGHRRATPQPLSIEAKAAEIRQIEEDRKIEEKLQKEYYKDRRNWE